MTFDGGLPKTENRVYESFVYYILNKEDTVKIFWDNMSQLQLKAFLIVKKEKIIILLAIKQT